MPSTADQRIEDALALAGIALPGGMSDEEIEHIARELQAAPHAKGPLRDPMLWEILSEQARDYWRAKARKGERAA
jgi:hypothetical protein